MKVNDKTIDVSHPKKLMYPDAGITKQDVIDYYHKIAGYMLPHITNRPLTLKRWPDGIDESSFYQKQRPDYFPDWLGGVDIDLKKGETQTQVVVESAAGLVYLADQACLELHRWLSTTDDLEKADLMVFDLDPSGGDYETVVFAARLLGDALQEDNLKPRFMLSGSRGIHVLTELKERETFDASRERAMEIAASLVEKHPEKLTVEPRKEDRGGRLYIDVTRNAFGQTVIVPYSLRGKPKAPVATPLKREELSASLRSDHYTLKTIFKRISQTNDPWK